jgi:hypothetical protein
MPIQYQGSLGTIASTGGPTSSFTGFTTDSSLTAGWVAVAFVYWNTAAYYPTGITDGHNAWVLAPNSIQYAPSGYNVALFVSTIATGGALTLTVAFSGAVSSPTVGGLMFSGVSGFDLSGGNSGNDIPTTPALAVTQANEALVAAFICNNAAQSTPTGWTAGPTSNASYYDSYYQIVSSKKNYFCPGSAANQYAAAIVSLPAVAVTQAIWGNAGVSGAAVSWTGTALGSTTAASDGSYSIPSLANGTYTVTPTSPGVTFNPANRTITILNDSVYNICFTPNFNWWTNKGAVIGASGAFQPEQPTVIYDINPRILPANPDGRIFKMWYESSGTTKLYYAESADGLTWSQYSGNPITLPGATGGAFGPRVVKVGITYYLYCTSALYGVPIKVYTCSDGLSWALQNANAVALGVSGFDSAGVGQLNVAGIASGTWYGYYWGAQTTSASTVEYYQGLVTSTDLIDWSKDGGNPVAAFDGGTLANGQTWNGASALGFIAVGGKYYAYGQVVPNSFPAAVPQLPNDLMMWSATSPAGPWTALGFFPYYRTVADEGVGSLNGQVADPCIMSALGNVYLFYTAGTGNGATYNVNLAVAYSTTPALLFAGNQGVLNVPIVGEPEFNFNTLASDNFSGALSGSWVQRVVSSGNYCAGTTASNTYRSAVLGDNADSYWGALTWNDDQWFRITVGACSSSSYVGGILRSGFNPLYTAQTAYRLYWNGSTGSGGTWTIQKFLNGSSSSLATGSATLNTGDTLTGVVIGTGIMLYWNDLLLGVVSDSGMASGAPGILVIPEGSLSNASITAWSAGNFVASSPTPPPPPPPPPPSSAKPVILFIR